MMGNIATILMMALELFFALSKLSGMADEDRDKLYEAKKAEYRVLPDPSKLKDV
jgi:hypothetical protein